MTTFTFKDQDDTLGNLLQSQLLEQPEVYFAAYKQEHPLDRIITVRIQTADSTTPEKELETAVKELKKQATQLQTAWKRTC